MSWPALFDTLHLASRRRNAHEVLVQVATCNNAAAQAEPVAELGAGIGAELRYCANICFVCRIQGKVKLHAPNKIEFNNKHEEGGR